MKSDYLLLYKHLFDDCANKCSTDTSRDIKTIKSRYHHEGLSFLTISLPNFLEQFHIALENQQVTSNLFPGWKKRLCLPAFLQGFTSLVFDVQTGRILDNEKLSTTAVGAVRQICSFFKKIKFDCSAEKTKKAFDSYCAIERELYNTIDSIQDSSLDTFLSVSKILWSHVFGRDIDVDTLIPHHGPGSTAEGITGNMKYVPKYTWPKRLNKYFPPELNVYNSDESYHYSNVEVETLELSDELPVKVITVPKTLKTPRLIAMEPIAMQYCQQSIKDYMVTQLEKNELTSGHVNFIDQSINQRLALENSLSRKMATIDLSAASDRVHKELVYLMLQANPKLRDLVFCTRSTTANVDGKILNLQKFASMGSALCFPIEAMFFYTCIVIALIKHRDLPISLESIKIVSRDAYVYGDDIIVPVNEVETVYATLSEFGNVVGLTKSFYKGYFRESCGMDAYKGVDVTPIYMRNPIPNSLRDASQIISCVATVNQLYKKKYNRTAIFLKEKIEEKTGSLPVISHTSEGLGWHFPCSNSLTISRYNAALQRDEIQTLVPKMRTKKDRIWGYSALTKCLINMELREKSNKTKHSFSTQWEKDTNRFNQISNFDRDHLSKTPRRGALTLKRRWVA